VRRPRLLAVIAIVEAVALVVVIAILILRHPVAPPPSPGPPPAHPQTADASADNARDAVVSYLKHLQEGDYDAAHRLLTDESRRRHPLEEFRRQAQQGSALYDLSSARAHITAPGRAEVTLHQEEDPAAVTIIAVRQGGDWSVVYLRGRPGSPYP